MQAGVKEEGGALALPWNVRPRDMLTLVGGVGVTAVLSFVYNVWCARSLGAAQYADFAAALGIVAILGYALNPLSLVTAQLASRFAAAGDLGRVAALYRALQRRFTLVTLLATIPAVPLALLTARLLRFESRTAVALAGGVAAILLLLAITRATLRATQRFGSYAGGLAGESLLRLTLGIPLVWMSPTATNALAAYLAAAAVVLAVHDRTLRRSWVGPREDADSVAGWSSLIGPSWALLIWYAVAQNVDLLIVKSLSARSDAGMYAAAATVARSLMLVLTLPLDAVLLPRMGAAPGNPRRTVAPVARLFVLLWSPPAVILVAFSRPIVTSVFGDSFEAAAPLVPWLVLAAMSMSCSYLTGQALLFLGTRRFLLLHFGGLALEAALILTVRGDFLATVRVVSIVQISIAMLTLGLWARASAPSDAPARH